MRLRASVCNWGWTVLGYLGDGTNENNSRGDMSWIFHVMGWRVYGSKCQWVEVYMGWSVYGLKCLWVEVSMCWSLYGLKCLSVEVSMGWSVYGLKCLWVEVYMGWSVYGLKCLWVDVSMGWSVYGLKRLATRDTHCMTYFTHVKFTSFWKSLQTHMYIVSCLS